MQSVANISHDSLAIRKKGWKNLMVFGIKKSFLEFAPQPKSINHRMQYYLSNPHDAIDQWLPE